jgi:hypothetical protein
MDADGSNSEASFSSTNEEFLEPKSPPSNSSSSKKDGARKRKLTNPVRLSSNIADDSNDEFCCYDDGTGVSPEDDDTDNENDEIDQYGKSKLPNGLHHGVDVSTKLKDTSIGGGSLGSPPSDNLINESPLGILPPPQHQNHHHLRVSTSSSPPSELHNEDNFLHSSSIKSECDMEVKNNIMIGEHSFLPKETEEKKRRKLSKDSSSEENHKNADDDNKRGMKGNDELIHNLKSEKSSEEDEEADHLGKLEALPIFSSPQTNSDSSLKSEDEENNGRSGGSPNSSE